MRSRNKRSWIWPRSRRKLFRQCRAAFEAKRWPNRPSSVGSEKSDIAGFRRSYSAWPSGFPGLNVPGHEQGGLPLKPNYKVPGLDMNRYANAMRWWRICKPCRCRLKKRKPATEQEAALIGAGRSTVRRHRLCELAMSRSLARSAASIATCCCTILATTGRHRQLRRVHAQHARRTAGTPFAASRCRRPEWRFRERRTTRAQLAKVIGGAAAGMANAAAVGRASRFGTLSARRPGRDARTSHRLPRRPRHKAAVKFFQLKSANANS